MEKGVRCFSHLPGISLCLRCKQDCPAGSGFNWVMIERERDVNILLKYFSEEEEEVELHILERSIGSNWQMF